MDAAADSLAELAPAKINLALHVTGRRPDGYHSIESLVVFTRFGDRITVAHADEDSFAVSGRYAADVPLGGDNLLLRAREALRLDAGPDRTRPAAINLEKNLPVASGVGGGSSDAASTLRGLTRLWRLDISESRLAEIGLGLGADVPMCLAGRPLIAAGVGETLSPVTRLPSLGLVLVNPAVAVATPAVFAALEKRDNERLPGLPDQIDFHSLWKWLDSTRNDLQPAAMAVHPAIGQALAALKRADAPFFRMSGSGATCFGLFETGNVAKRAAASIRARHPDWFVAATRSIPSEGEAHEQD